MSARTEQQAVANAEARMQKAPDTTKAWPYYMARYMMEDDDSTFEDLIWSVGGSPPYGGVSHDEAGAVFHLVEDFRGKGIASPEKYAAVGKFVEGKPDKERMLEAFRCYDEIVSDSEGYSSKTVARGLTVAEAIGDPGIIGLFKLFEAGIATREGRNKDAARIAVEALDPLLTAAETDPAASHRVEQAAQNAVALTALAGDNERAEELLEELSDVLPAKATEQLRRWLNNRK